MSAAEFEPRGLIARLPRRPGVYRMYDAAGTLIYVGKATELRSRVGSYFGRSSQAPKVAAMLKRVARLEFTVVNSEAEALILESNLIKQHRPRYNILLRDDKSFPWILAADRHEFPRLVYWRSLKRPVGKLYGPFPNSGAARETVLQLQKTFRLRNCRDSFFAHRSRPCLQYQIGRCTAPCVGLISAEDYGRDFRAATEVLDGHSDSVGADLRARMHAAAEAQEFERAALLRDQIAGLEQVRMEQIAAAPRERDVDAIAIVGLPGDYALAVLTVRDGKNLGTEQQLQAGVAETGETLAAFVLLYYAARAVPAELLLNIDYEGMPALQEALSLQARHAVRISRPTRGLGARWVEQAEVNAAQALKLRDGRAAGYALAAAELTAALELPAAPQRIECFDISHTGGEGAVASAVVHLPQGASRKEYRRYNLRETAAGDDYGALREALRRHGAHVLAGDLPRPDLLLIDGGAAQLRAAAEGLQEAGCGGLELAAISKGPDRRAGQELLHRPGSPQPVRLAPDSAALHLLQRVRDEAHRFAITAHRRRRAQRFRESILETVPGLGPARRRALLTHFGGLQGVLRAGPAELARVPGVGANLARNLYDHLHPGET